MPTQSHSIEHRHTRNWLRQRTRRVKGATAIDPPATTRRTPPPILPKSTRRNASIWRVDPQHPRDTVGASQLRRPRKKCLASSPMSAVDTRAMTSDAPLQDLSFLEPEEVGPLVSAALEGDCRIVDETICTAAAPKGVRKRELLRLSVGARRLPVAHWFAFWRTSRAVAGRARRARGGACSEAVASDPEQAPEMRMCELCRSASPRRLSPRLGVSTPRYLQAPS